MPALHLPPEIYDHIVDLLQVHPCALKQCCLISKSWVPRTRKHLFAEVRFSSGDRLKSWKNVFPDPASSPGYHTRTLSVCRNLEDAGDGNWLAGFPRVERLEFALSAGGPIDIPFAAFRQLSSSVKSLAVAPFIPNPHFFNLICSLPLLEDLYFRDWDAPTNEGESVRPQAAVSSLTSPSLTGTLSLQLIEWMVEVLRPLLGLPGGLRFRKLDLSLFDEEGLLWAVRLVAACSSTLEYLEVGFPVDSTLDSVSSSVPPFPELRPQVLLEKAGSISPERRNSRILGFCVRDPAVNGLSQRLKQSRPIIGIFGELQSVPPPLSGTESIWNPLCCGQTSTALWYNYANHTYSV